MKEQFLSYLWFNKLYFSEQRSLLGEKIEIISPGIRNVNSGPDAFNAKIKIGSKIWAGDVEFHVNASDWHKHKHDGNKEYNSVILHVVLNADEQIFIGERPLPTIELQYPKHIALNYSNLKADGMRCKRSNTTEIEQRRWIERLVIERLEEKTGRIEQILQENNMDYEATTYLLLARSLGFGVNSNAMEALAKSVPLKAIMHHRDNLLQIEAMLLGQAGFLYSNEADNDLNPSDCQRQRNFIVPGNNTEEEYIREYKFLKNKFLLQDPKHCAFKLLRMRPNNFPAIRIAQLAAILHNNDNLFNKILETEPESIHKIFMCNISDYWKTHYIFGRESNIHNCNITRRSCDLIMINTVIPMLFVYGKSHNEQIKEEALSLLQKIKPENNHITERFKAMGIKCDSAFESQALIQLQNHYCDNKRCMECQIGYDLIKKREQTPQETE